MRNEPSVTDLNPSGFTHRVAFPPEAPYDFYLRDDWYLWLKEIGYTGIFLSPDPRDRRRTAEFDNFTTETWLLNLWDFSRSPDRDELSRWVQEVCDRAHRQGLKVYLAIWEPKLPIQAWGLQPSEWLGRGSHTAPPFDRIGWCLTHPDAAADYQRMVREAFSRLPDIDGVVAGSLDNEAFLCNARCPRCAELSRATQLARVYRMLGQALEDRDEDFDFVLYTWWWTEEEKLAVADAMNGRPLSMLGRSTIGLPQDWQGRTIGRVADLSLAPRGLSPQFATELEICRRHGWPMTDMTVFGHTFEYFFLPYTPAPEAVVNRLNVLRDAGSAGWFDYDCGGVHPGINVEIIRDWLQDPLPSDQSLSRTLSRLFPNCLDAAQDLYAACDLALTQFPYGLQVSDVGSLNGRNMGGLTLALPFASESFSGLDQGHRTNWFDPANLMTRESVPTFVGMLAECGSTWRRALALSAGIAPSAAYAVDFAWEQRVIEVHALATESLWRYARLAAARFARADRQIDEAEETRLAREIQRDELAACRRLYELWKAEPLLLYNSNWRIGMLAQKIWLNDRIDEGDPLASKIAIMEQQTLPTPTHVAPMSLAEYTQTYERDGVVVIPDVIPPDRIAACLHDIAKADAVRWDDDSTWPESRRLNGGLDLPSVAALFAEVIVPYVASFLAVPQGSLAWPVSVNRIVAFPGRADAQQALNPHVDGTNANNDIPVAEHLARFQTYVLVYLTETPPDGGGTAVWPGSHHMLQQAIAAAAPPIERMPELPTLLERLPLSPPTITTPPAGSLVLMHPFCIHSPSANCSSRPRVALRVSL